MLIFTVFAFSFCVLQFSVEPTENAVTATHIKEEGLGKLHVSVSESLARTIKDTWSAVKEAAGALPFFVRDAAGAIGDEVEQLCISFGEALSARLPEDAVKI